MYNTNQLNSFKYAQMQSSLFNKSNASTSSIGSKKFNLKAKFTSIQQALNGLEQQLRDASTATKQSLRLTGHLKVELGERELGEHEKNLSEQIKKLEKCVKYGISESEKKSENLWTECKSRIATTENLKKSMKNLTDRTNRLQNTLGIYSGSQTMI